MEIVLKLTLNEVQVILAALGKLPLESSLAVWNNVKTQAEPQVNKTEPNENQPSELT